MIDRVAAIRNHPRVGRGTCTVVDECYEDRELVESLDEWNITTEGGAIEWALGVQGMYLERACNAREGNDDDWQLLALKAWEEHDDAEAGE